MSLEDLEAMSGKKGERLIPLVVALSLFMHLMDTAALATALPTIAGAFGASPVDMSLALTAYLLTIAMLVPTSAWLSAKIGTKRLFVAAMVGFALGSIACALSQNVTQLIAARILQGAGGAMMTPVGRSLLVALTPRKDLIRAMTLFTLPGVIAPLVGPPLAALLVETAGWRWIFLINLPVCTVAVAAVILIVPRLEEPPAGRFDVLGFLIVLTGMGLLSALIDGGGWNGRGLAIKAVLAALLLAATYLYRWHAARISAPLLDLALWRLNTLRFSLIAGFFQRLPVGALPFLLPLLLQEALGMTPLAASYILIASAAGALAARFALPMLLRVVPVRQAATFSAAAAAILTALASLFDGSTPIWTMIAVMGVLGLIRAAFFVPVTAIGYDDLPPHLIGQATIVFTMIQQFSFGLGISISAGLLAWGHQEGDRLVAPDFTLPFCGIAVLAALAIPALLQLDPTVGKEMR